ncbi:hypothetical protein LRP57_08165 [Schaalia sp. lx-260]|nr:hypothetical protein [Schaalia sp. lx-260]
MGIVFVCRLMGFAGCGGFCWVVCLALVLRGFSCGGGVCVVVVCELDSVFCLFLFCLFFVF